MMDEMEDNRPIRFLIDDNGRTVWKTFTGKVLVGNLNMGIPAMHEDRLDCWQVAQAANGKLVVCRGDADGPGELAIYETWEAMQARVPAHIFEIAQEKAGLVKKPEYPEEPLDI